MKAWVIVATVMGMVLIAGCGANVGQEVNSFEDCVNAGNAVMESYPPKCNHNGEVFTKQLSSQEQCENLHNGTWLPEYQECEDITENACDQLNGTYSNCASACRHDPDAGVCTAQCVPVCSLGNSSQ